MIGIASLGMGNISAITNIYDDYDIKYVILRSSKDYEKKINKIILPGVSSFDEAMASIIEKDFDNLLKDFCRNKNNFLLGICVGMQVLGNTSEEGVLNGLSLIQGSVNKFKNIKPLPHVGWNNVEIKKDQKILNNIENNSKFYFLHSYQFIPDNKDNIIATTNYFGNFASIVKNENVIGIQFHPEKSHNSGINLLNNFAYL